MSKRYLAVDLALALCFVAVVFLFIYAAGQAAEHREYEVSDWCRAHPAECGLPTPNGSTKE